MRVTKSLAALGAALAAAAATTAQADVLYELPAATGRLDTGTISVTFDAAAGDGSVAFQIDGYSSLDGDNCCTDTFTLTLNSVLVLNARMDMGGGGSSYVFNYAGPPGLSFTSQSFGLYAGGVANFVVPLTLAEGSNTLSFSYFLNEGGSNEGWGVGSATVTGDPFVASPGVPEPTTWAMMILGFGLAGTVVRRRRLSPAA